MLDREVRPLILRLFHLCSDRQELLRVRQFELLGSCLLPCVSTCAAPLLAPVVVEAILFIQPEVATLHALPEKLFGVFCFHVGQREAGLWFLENSKRKIAVANQKLNNS